MKHENPHVDVSPLVERIILHVPDEYLKDSFKTREAADATLCLKDVACPGFERKGE